MSDTIQNFIGVNDKSIFDSPSQLDSERFNFTEFRPVAGLSFTASQNIEVRIQCQTEMIDWSRSYMRGNFTASASDAQLSSMGIGAVFKTLTEIVSGYSLPIQADINLVKSVENKLVTGERKGFIDVTESANMSGTIGTTLTNFALPIPGILASSSRYFPSPVIRGGIHYNFQLETDANVFTAGTSPTFTITDFSIVLCLIQPSANYITELTSGYAKGGALNIPVEIKKVVHTPAIALDTFTLPIQTGFLRSVNSISVLHRLASNMNSASADAFGSASGLLVSNKQLSYWNLQVDSTVYPRNKFMYYYGKRPEYLMQNLLCGTDTQYSALTAPASGNDFLHYNFKSNGSFQSGISTQTGSINLNMKYASAPSSSDLISAIVTYDGVLKLQSGVVDVVFN